MLVSRETSIVAIAGCELELELDPEISTSPSRVGFAPRRGEEQTKKVGDRVVELTFDDAPDLIDVEWLDENGKPFATTHVEVLSRHYFEIPELIEYGDGCDDFDELSIEKIEAARMAAVEVFEKNAARSFVKRIGRTKVYQPSELIWLEHNDVDEILTPGFTLLSDCQAAFDGTSESAWPAFVEYVYGADEMPAQVSRAVLALAAYMLRPSSVPERATGESVEGGFIRYTIAGRDGATGLPEVDATIEQFGRKRVMVL